MRVAVAGHRWNRIDPEVEAGRLADLLRKAMVALPGSDGPVTLVTGMAEGTDLTAATVRPSNWQLEAALALPEPLWREHLEKVPGVGPEDLVAYDRLIKNAMVVFTGTESHKPDYAALAAYLGSTCSHLVTVWNGIDGPQGGTSDVVSRAKEKGATVINLWSCLTDFRYK